MDLNGVLLTFHNDIDQYAKLQDYENRGYKYLIAVIVYVSKEITFSFWTTSVAPASY